MKVLMGCGIALTAGGLTAFGAADFGEFADWLQNRGEEIVKKAERKMNDGRTVYAPQAGGWYKAAWLRDYAMTQEGGLIPKERQNGVAELYLSAVTPEGDGFDCIKFDGSVMQRPAYNEISEKPVMDGYTYMTSVAYETWKQTGDARWLRSDILDKLVQMLDRMPHRNGLPWIDPERPHERCPWGFTDSVQKTGNIFFTSLLEIRARRELATLLEAAGRPDVEIAKQRRRATELVQAVNCTFWDDKTGLYLAATIRCRQHDIWGSAYAVWLGVAPDDRADRVALYFRDHYDGLVQCGQIRHLPAGEYWEKTCWDRTDFYQNGHYWGTATGWFCWTLERIAPSLVDKTFADLIADYKSRGPNEHVFGAETHNPEYLTSVAMPLQALRRLIALRKGY